MATGYTLERERGHNDFIKLFEQEETAMSDTQRQIPDDVAECKRVVRELCLPILIAGLVIMAIAWISIEIRDQGREEGIRIGRGQVIEELYPNSSE